MTQTCDMQAHAHLHTAARVNVRTRFAQKARHVGRTLARQLECCLLVGLSAGGHVFPAWRFCAHALLSSPGYRVSSCDAPEVSVSQETHLMHRAHVSISGNSHKSERDR